MASWSYLKIVNEVFGNKGYIRNMKFGYFLKELNFYLPRCDACGATFQFQTLGF